MSSLPAGDSAPAPAPATTIAATLARFAADLDLAGVPGAVVEKAKLSILDAIGIALASNTYEFARRSLQGIRALGGDGGHVVIGQPWRLPLRDAVMANGTLVHGLDFDDTHSASVLHATASAFPTVLGVGEQQNVSGAGLLAAYLVAVEADARIGAAGRGQFQVRGFHPTGLIGAFGATLAAGRLQGLDADALTHAQGIVLSLASGSLEFLEDGAWTKRMHPGWAGVGAVTACALAQAGFAGPGKPYEGRYGLYRTHLGPDTLVDLALCTADLGSTWEMLNVAVKPYPVCHFIHAFADAALALRRAHGLAPADIESVTALIHPDQVQVVCEPEAAKRVPTSDYEGKFSLHYVVASALVKDRFTLDELEDDALRDPATLELAKRVSYQLDDRSLFPKYYSGAITIRTRDGRELTHREDHNRGSDANPLSAADIIEKFHANAARAIARPRAEAIADAVMGLESAPGIDALVASLASAG